MPLIRKGLSFEMPGKFEIMREVRKGLDRDVLQLSKSGKRAIGRVDRAPSHAATSNSLLMN